MHLFFLYPESSMMTSKLQKPNVISCNEAKHRQRQSVERQRKGVFVSYFWPLSTYSLSFLKCYQLVYASPYPPSVSHIQPVLSFLPRPSEDPVTGVRLIEVGL